MQPWVATRGCSYVINLVIIRWAMPTLLATETLVIVICDFELPILQYSSTPILLYTRFVVKS